LLVVHFFIKKNRYLETNKNFLVYKSSAGSGKTYTLVREYLKLCLQSNDSSRYKNILAITFTNKAAKEMKERVLSGLQILTESTQIKNENKVFLQDFQNTTQLTLTELENRSSSILKNMLHNYSDIHIKTIDKFVHGLIRTFSKDLKLSTDFEIELDSSKLLLNTIDKLISRAGQDKEITEMLLDFIETKLESDSDWQIDKSILEFSKNLLKEESYQYIEKLKLFTYKDYKQLYHKFTADNKVFETKIKEFGSKAISIIEKNSIEKSWLASGENTGISKYFSYLKDFKTDSLEPTKTHEHIISSSKWHSGKCPPYAETLIENIKPDLIKIYNEALCYISENYSRYKEKENLKKNIFNISLITAIKKELRIIKEEKNILPIHEFNTIISDIISNEPTPFIYERIGNKFKNYLVDEFQDTSILQWQNLLPLLDESLSNSNYNMIVGDAKQSIYRFRGGEVEQFSKLPKIFPHTYNTLQQMREKILEANFRKVNLEKNFRSNNAIVDFNNNIYENLKEILHANYKEIYFEQKQLKNDSKEIGYVNFKCVSPEELIEAKNSESENPNLTNTLKSIKESIEDGYNYKDIAVIIRKNIDGINLANFLTENNIPITSSESLLLEKNNKVDFLINLLNCIINKNDYPINFKIAKFIHSYLGGKEDFTEFISIYTIDKYLNIEKLLKENNLEVKFLNKNGDTVYQIIEKIIRKFKFNSNNDAYLHFFLEEIFKQSISGNTSISNFLNWWNENKEKLSIKTPDNLDAVRILTIHKSKGLEFPIVILPFLNWNLNDKHKEIWVDLDEAIYSLPASIIELSEKKNKDTIFEQSFATEKNKILLDLLNLLYVATTRPRERLYGFYSIKSGNNSASFGNHIHNALLKVSNLETDQNIFQFGTKNNKIYKDQQPENIINLNNVEVTKVWDSKFNIAQAPERFFGYNQEYQKEIGKEIHRILSLIKYEEGADEIIKRETIFLQDKFLRKKYKFTVKQ
jgi:ATP-dependent exoDNAse (exonuclease V) beta subunit